MLVRGFLGGVVEGVGVGVGGVGGLGRRGGI